MSKSLMHLPCVKWPKYPGTFALKTKMTKGNAIEAYKILHSVKKAARENIFSLALNPRLEAT